MNLWETIKVAWEGLGKNKVRSLLSMLGIIIGVSAVIVMMAVSAGTEATIKERISGLGSNLLIIRPEFSGARMPGQGGGMPESLEYEDALAIEQEVSGIVGAVAEQMASAQVVKAGSQNVEVEVVGAMPSFPAVRGVELADGRFFTQQDLDRSAKVAVLGYQTAQDLFGDQDPIGQTRSPEVAYVAALGRLWGPNPERGVFRTSDGGKSWQHVLKVDADTGACAVAVDPGSPDTVYAAPYARRRTPWSYTGVSAKGGIFRSDDAGKTWKKLKQELQGRAGRIGLSIFPADPKIVYAVVESDEGGSGRDPFDDRSTSGGVFRSDDRGESWTRVSDINFRPFYFSKIAVDPKDANRVYLPGWGVARSHDGGNSFPP